MAELSDKYLSNTETARSVQSIDVLMRICEVLKTTPDKILLGAVSEPEKTEMKPVINQKIAALDKKADVYLQLYRLA